MGTVFGIDFGTSNSALSINVDGKNHAIDIDKHSLNKKLLKSIIFYDYAEKEYLYGAEAVERYIETDAEGRYIQSIKTFLPDTSFKDTRIGGKSFTIEDIVSMILRRIKVTGEEYLGQEVNDVVLGRPVIFSEIAEKEQTAETRLIKAAKLSGFKNVHLEYEPIAAARCYEETLKAGDEHVVLVCDFGGGTSDFSVIKLRGKTANIHRDRKKDILSLGGVYIGGDSLDSKLMWEELANEFGRGAMLLYPMTDSAVKMPVTIMDRLKQWHLIPQLNTPKMISFLHEIKNFTKDKPYIENLISLIENNYGYTLFKAIENSKIELSTANISDITYSDYTIALKRSVTIERFNEVIYNEVTSLQKCIQKTVVDAGLKISDIDKVMLTGGTSNVPLIHDYLVTTFGAEKMTTTDAFTSVGQGLGLCGRSFFE